MSQATQPTDPDLESERQLLEVSVAEARTDCRPSVPHDQVRADMLHEIERLKLKVAEHRAVKAELRLSALDGLDGPAAPRSLLALLAILSAPGEGFPPVSDLPPDDVEL